MLEGVGSERPRWFHAAGVSTRMNRLTKPTDATSDRVLRGGSWGGNGPSWVRAASRGSYVPANRNFILGFRCALRGREPRA